VYVDRRAGSAELWPLLTQRQIPAELTTLDYGDCCLSGHGPEGEILIGIERKTIRDLASSLTSGRLSGHQIPGLVATYGYRWLLVEGSWRADADGNATVPGFRKGRGATGWDRLGLKAAALEGYLLTVTLRAGIHVQRTYSIQESADWIGSLHRWWTSRKWADHRAHLALHQPEPDSRLWVAPNTVQKVAACLPGIGAEKSLAVSRHFKSVLELALADEKAWQQVDGIGKGIAARVTRIVQQGD